MAFFGVIFVAISFSLFVANFEAKKSAYFWRGKTAISVAEKAGEFWANFGVDFSRLGTRQGKQLI